MKETGKTVHDLTWDIQNLLQAASSGDYSMRLQTSISQSLAENPLITLVPAINLLLDDLVAKEKKKQYAENKLNETIQNLEQKLDTIEKQREAIQELSTPVIQIWEKIVVLPLIGAVDTARSQQIQESLLLSIREKSVEIAIIDLTGVPVIDTGVAGHLISAINSAKLLGAEVILTGIGVHNAQTMVSLGIPFEKLLTKGTLQAGLKLAFKMTGK